MKRLYQGNRIYRGGLFGPLALFLIILVFFTIILGSRHLLFLLNPGFPLTPTWPVNVLDLRPNPEIWQFLYSGFILMLLVVVTWGLKKKQFNNAWVLVAVLIFLPLANLVHGWQVGFERPLEGTAQYFADLPKVTSPGRFIAGFNQIQTDLSIHGRTHPPGAVLIFYFLDQVTGGKTGFISLLLSLLATGLTAAFLMPVLRQNQSREMAGGLTWLFFLIPGVTIYYCASLDAILAAFTVGILYFLGKKPEAFSTFGAGLFLLFLSFCNFAFLLPLAIFVACDFGYYREWKRSLLIIGGLLAFYLLLWGLSGFNYWNAFRVAHGFENPDGIGLFHLTKGYMFSRIQNVFELVVFWGPFVTLLVFRSFFSNPRFRDPGYLLPFLGLGGLFAVFIWGAYRFGETGRACLYIYPFALLAIKRFFDQKRMGVSEVTDLCLLCGTQTVLMQLWASYFW